MGASVGSWEVLAEVAPEPRELGSLVVGLEWQGRAWYLSWAGASGQSMVPEVRSL